MGLVPGARCLLKIDKEEPCPEGLRDRDRLRRVSRRGAKLPDDEAFAEESEQLRLYLGYTLRQRSPKRSATTCESAGAKVNTQNLEGNPYR